MNGRDYYQHFRLRKEDMRIITAVIVAIALLGLSYHSVVAQAPPKIADLIALKARDFKLGNARPESPAPRQTPAPRNQGWWQAFDGGWVYWSPTNGAHVVAGEIFEAWGRQGWEQGSLMFPVADEEMCVAPDTRDRYQRFEGGVIYRSAATNEATVYNNDARNRVTFALNGVCSPIAVVSPSRATPAPLGTLEVAPRVSVPAEGPKPDESSTARVPVPAVDVFRVKILGFRVEHVVQDGVFDAGDDAYVAWDTAEFDTIGDVQNHLTGQSLVYGDVDRGRVRVAGGSRRSPEGGLQNGDTVLPPNNASAANRLPLLVGDFKLVDGKNAVVFAPTIWISRNDAGNYFNDYRARIDARLRLASADIRTSLKRNSTDFHWIYSGTADLGGWFDQWVLMTADAEHFDRPLGISEGLVMFQRWGALAAFKPHFFLLTYRSVMRFLDQSGHGSDHEPVDFEARYADSGPHGIYIVLMQIQRID